MPDRPGGDRPPVAAASGFSWILQSLALLQRQPARLLLVAVLMQLVLSLTQFPLLGILVVVAVPALNAGILEAFHVTAQGGPPSAGLLFRPLTSGEHAGRLLGLGALVVAVGIVSMSLLLPAGGQLPDQDVLARVQEGDMEALALIDQGYLQRLLLAFMVGVAVSGTLSYFTIPLIWFGGRRLGPALVEGLRLMLRNWLAMLALGFGLAVAAVPIAVIAGMLVSMASAAGALALVVTGLVMLLVLLYQMLLFGTQYCAYRQLVGMPRPQVPDDESQLVA